MCFAYVLKTKILHLKVNKACKSYGALFRKQCYIYSTRQRSMRKSGRSYKCFDMLQMFPVLLSSTFTCRWVVHFHYEIGNFSAAIVAKQPIITFLACIFIFYIHCSNNTNVNLCQLIAHWHASWQTQLTTFFYWACTICKKSWNIEHNGRI